METLGFWVLYFKESTMYYFDKCLLISRSLCCAIFEKFATLLEWATVKIRVYIHRSFLDDFRFAGSNCYNLMRSFQSIGTECDDPLAVENTQGPVTCLTFLGIEIDTNHMSIAILREKKY